MKTCWVICQYEEPIAAIETEADAEEIFMDLVMEEQYDFCNHEINLGGLSMADCNKKEWLWKSDFEYYIIPIFNLL